MRTTKLLATLAAMSMFGVAGCSSGAAGSDKAASGEVSMWAYPLSKDKDEAFWKEQVAVFEKSHPGIKIKVTVQPWENRDQLLTTAIAGGTAPDSFYIIGGQVSQYQQLGALAPLDDYVSASQKSDFTDNALDAATREGKLLMLPEVQGSMLVAYYKPAFAKAGITRLPTTWGDLEAAAPKLKAAGYYAMEYQANVGTLNQNFLPFFWQAGGSLFDDNGKKVTFNSGPAREALTFLKGMVDDGYVPKELLTQKRTNRAIPSDHSVKKDVAMQPIADNSAATGLIEAWGQDNIAFGPPLTGPKQQQSYGLVAGYAMLAGAKHKAATAEWLKFVTSKDVAPKVLGLFNGLPARKSLSAMYPASSPFSQYVKYLPMMRENDKNPTNRTVMTILEPQIQAVLIGEKSIDQALSEAEAEANRALG